MNPHAGDGGLLGKEEQAVIIPALSKARSSGLLVFGPFPADGFFGAGTWKKYDGVVSMYHDQGLAPFKALPSKEASISQPDSRLCALHLLMARPMNLQARI